MKERNRNKEKGGKGVEVGRTRDNWEDECFGERRLLIGCQNSRGPCRATKVFSFVA